MPWRLTWEELYESRTIVDVALEREFLRRLMAVSGLIYTPKLEEHLHRNLLKTRNRRTKSEA